MSDSLHNDDLPQDVPWERLARLEISPLRVAIVELLAMDGGRTLSPGELSFELQASHNATSYHATELRKAGLVRLAHERRVRGSTERFYCLPKHSAHDLLDRLR